MRKPFVCLALAAIGTGAFAQESAPKPSAVRDKAKVLAMIQALEADPLGPKAKDQRTALVYWLTEVPDLTVALCPDVLAPTDKFGKYKGELTGHLMFSQAAYILEHPGASAEKMPAQVAGAKGALRVYRTLLKADAKAATDVLNELVATEERGELEAHVARGWQVCKASK